MHSPSANCAVDLDFASRRLHPRGSEIALSRTWRHLMRSGEAPLRSAANCVVRSAPHFGQPGPLSDFLKAAVPQGRGVRLKWVGCRQSASNAEFREMDLRFSRYRRAPSPSREGSKPEKTDAKRSVAPFTRARSARMRRRWAGIRTC
jgi:hypothetical protein